MISGFAITTWNNWRKLEEHGEFCWFGVSLDNRGGCLQLVFGLFGFGIVFSIHGDDCAP